MSRGCWGEGGRRERRTDSGDFVEQSGYCFVKSTFSPFTKTYVSQAEQQNKAEEALEDTKACLVLSPESFKALRTQARCHLALENYEEAVQSFKAALNSGSSVSTEDERSLKKELQKTEVLLKRSKAKDYYKILGLAKDCNESEIKKAYRRESLIHHPDKVRAPFLSLSSAR